jgi:glycolate oxidase FAD binding subunit
MKAAALTVTDRVLLDFADEVGDSGPVAVVGGRTCWDLGGSLDAGARELTAPTGVVAYAPAEMTVTVRAGTTVADLHHELASHGQRTALPERGGTVGGAVAVGHNDLGRRARGTVAASVLQLRYVSAEGRVVTGGGPTVKNVTGFDLPRLLVGSLGTLGLLAELVLRTNPIPSVSCWVQAADADPFAVSDQLLRPSAVLWDGRQVWVNLEGHGPDVEADLRQLATLGTFNEGDPPLLPAHRWSLTPADLRSLAGPETPFVASVGVGTVWASNAQPARALDPVVVAISRRVKDNFDPSGRLNPGRLPGRT